MKKCIIVIAHADDETLWASSLLMRFKNCEWSVLCCSISEKDPIRSTAKFFGACSLFGANAMLMNELDLGIHEPLKELDKLDLTNYDHIFTHNEVGEYGHLHHKQIHRHIKANFSSMEQTYFGFRIKNPTHTFHLNPSEIELKLKAIKCYDHVHNNKHYHDIILAWLTKIQYSMAVESFVGKMP